jgi:hypothetical protein
VLWIRCRFEDDSATLSQTDRLSTFSVHTVKELLIFATPLNEGFHQNATTLYQPLTAVVLGELHMQGAHIAD